MAPAVAILAALVVQLALATDAAAGSPQATADSRQPTAGSAGDTLFQDANSAFLAADLPRAVSAYEALLEEGTVSPELETNLGAALLRQGKRGQAALHFERALFLDPADEDARADLIELRRSNVDRLEGEAEDGGAEALVRVFAPLPGTGAALLLLLSWTLGFALLGARLFLPGLSARMPLGTAAVVALGVALLSGGVSAASAAGYRLVLRRAVVVAQSAPAREGPAPKSASPFEVHEGTLVRVEDAENGYRRIKLANGLTGWVPKEAVEPIVPPSWGGLNL